MNLPGLNSVLRVLLGLVLMTATAAHAAPFAYIANGYTHDISVIDLATNTVTATVFVGGTPYGVAVNVAGTRAYITVPDANAVKVLDTATNSIVATVGIPGSPFGGGASPYGVAVNSAGTRVYVVNIGMRNMSVIDALTNTLIATVEVGLDPYGVAVSPDGTRVYVTNDGPGPGAVGEVAVIDSASNAVIAHISTGGQAGPGIAVNSAGTRVYASYNRYDVVGPLYGWVMVIDAQTNTPLDTAAVGMFAGGLAVNPAGTRVYATSHYSNKVAVLGTRCNEPMDYVVIEPEGTFQAGSQGVTVDPSGTRVYVVAAASASVKVIDAATDTVVASVPVGIGSASYGIFISPAGIVPPPPPPPPTPIHVTGIELTQGIQDLNNSVTVLYGKRTYARVHVKSDGPDVANVTASLSGLGAFLDGGGNVIRIPLGPLVPSNSGGPRIAVKFDPKRSIVDDSFLFELPWNWLAFESLRLHATLSEPAGPVPESSCMRDLEAGPGANIERPTTLKVAFVRMGYQFPGSTIEKTSSLEQRQTESWMRRAYPLSDLNPTPDFELFDAALGTWVKRTDPGCVAGFSLEERNLCAHFYTTARLGSLYATTDFFGFPDGHHIDDIDVVYGLIPQHFLNVSPEPFFTRGACCTNGVGAGPAQDEDYASHEIGHFLGRQHPVEGAAVCSHSPDDPNYPYFLSFIAPPLSDPQTAMAGFDGGDANLQKSARVLPPGSNYDIMGYCDPTWISDYTYHWLYLCLLTLHEGGTTAGCPPPVSSASAAKALNSAPQSGDWLLVYGQIASTGASAVLLDIERVDRIFSEPPRTPGNYSIRLVGSAGATLADYSFTPKPASDAVTSGGGGAPMLFGHAVPFVAGTREIRIVNTSAGGTTLVSKSVSSQPPVITNVTTQGDPNTGAVTLAWTASDADGDVLHFDVMAARNGGASLQPLMLGLSGTTTAIDTSALAGGAVALRVVASDGILTAYADSSAMTLANRPPQPRVLSPANGAHVTLGQAINLEGQAKDLQDGVLADAGLTWSSQHGALGSGARLSVADLPLGINVLTLSATNSLGLAAVSSVTITVDADPVTLGPTLTAGPGQLGWHVAQGETQLQTALLDIGNRGGGNLQFMASSGAPWLTLSASTGSAPATLTLIANPAGFAGGISADTTVTITAVGNPAQRIIVPVRLSVGDTFDAGNAPPTAQDVIYRDGFEGL